MDIRSRVGINIQKARQAKGWSQEELAHQSGVDRSYLSEVECGRKNVGIVKLESIANALEIGIKKLFE
jgi:transcriptional regulator with XRE-family HTH domain